MQGLTGFLDHAENAEDSKKIGRPEEIKAEDLATRYRDMKWFIENYWGRFGLRIKQVREPEDVDSFSTAFPRLSGAHRLRATQSA